MRYIIALLLLLVPVGVSAGEVAEHASALMARLRTEGMAQIALSDGLSKVDRQILRLMAQASGDTFAQLVLGPEPDLARHLVMTRGDVAPAPRLSRLLSPRDGRRGMTDIVLYSVNFTNLTSRQLDEVIIFWTPRVETGIPRTESKAPFPPHQLHVFALGECADMQHYVLGVFLDGDMVVKVPENGNMTPQLASQINSNDREPCSDSWIMHENRQ